MQSVATIGVTHNHHDLRRQAEALAKACHVQDYQGAAAFLVWWLLGPDQYFDHDEYDYRQNLELINRIHDGVGRFKKSLSYADGYNDGMGVVMQCRGCDGRAVGEKACREG